MAASSAWPLAAVAAVAVLAALACLPLWLQAAPQRNGHWLALLLPLHAALALAWNPRRRTDTA